MKMSDHATSRARERLSLSSKASKRLAGFALDRGKTPAHYVGSFRRYLDAQAMVKRSVIRVHGEHVYIFSSDLPTTLITVVLIPAKYRRFLRRLSERDRGL